MSLENTLVLFTKERGLAKIIVEMKSHMEYRDYIDSFDGNWELISNQRHPLDFVRLYKDKLNWYFIQMNFKFTDDELIEFQDYIKWDEYHPELCNTVEVIGRFADRMNWDYVFARLDCLSDDMIRRFGHRFQSMFRLHFVYGIPIEYVQRVKDLTGLPDVL